jgi:hypothetical protein
MSSDPEVVTSSLDGLTVEGLVRVARSKGESSASLPWILGQGRSIAAIHGQ